LELSRGYSCILKTSKATIVHNIYLSLVTSK